MEIKNFIQKKWLQSKDLEDPLEQKVYDGARQMLHDVGQAKFQNFLTYQVPQILEKDLTIPMDRFREILDMAGRDYFTILLSPGGR